jgi:hypothetical protein
MVLGYPGLTYRSLIAEEMAERRDRFFPRREEVFGEWIRAIEGTTRDVPDAQILVASDLKSLLNRYKNAQGQIAGLPPRAHRREAAGGRRRGGRVGGRRTRRARRAGGARRAARRARRSSSRRGSATSCSRSCPIGTATVPGSAGAFSKMLYHAVAIAHLARERAKPEAEREAGFAERDVARLEGPERARGEEHVSSSRSRGAGAVHRAAAGASRGPARAVGRARVRCVPRRARPPAGRIAEMYAASGLTSPAERARMLDEPEAALARARIRCSTSGSRSTTTCAGCGPGRPSGTGGRRSAARVAPRGHRARGPARRAGRKRHAARQLRAREGLLAARCGDLRRRRPRSRARSRSTRARNPSPCPIACASRRRRRRRAAGPTGASGTCRSGSWPTGTRRAATRAARW